MDGPRSSIRRLPYIRALDGLRCYAIISVMLFHYGSLKYFRGGWVGVDVFFVLSGFLITGLIVGERDQTGRFSFRNFYARRALRLLPALLLFVSVWIALYLVFGRDAWFWNGTGTPRGLVPTNRSYLSLFGLAGALTYTTNWFLAFGAQKTPLSHLWSLAIEEQFYLVWPVILLAVMKQKRAALLVCTLTILAATWSIGVFVMTQSVRHAYYGSDTRAQELLIGGAISLGWRSGATERIPQGIRRGFAIGGAAVLVIVLFALRYGSKLSFEGGLTIISLAAAAIILWLLHTPHQPWLLTNRFVVHVGQISYALYLWHYMFALWSQNLGVLGSGIGVGLSLVAAEFSRVLVERPAVRFKGRFRSA